MFLYYMIGRKKLINCKTQIEIMNLNRYKIIFLLIAFAGTLQAQRFVEEMFNVEVTPNIVYAENISILTGAPETIPLVMDVYQPAGDTETDRPVVIYFHTGSFLPPLFNGGITGSKSDSATVEICTRLARRGYVAVAASYRQGWRPDAVGPDGQNIRTGTLLNAAYRGIHDARACIRFFQNSIQNEGNPYGISSDRIALWGTGTGGYVSLGAGFLDREDELNLPKFIDSDTAENYVDLDLSGNVQGDVNTPLNIANNPGFSTDVAMVVNMGGALGDISWMDGQANEPVLVGFHCLRDPFAPFADGPVIVPTTGDFVVNVSGTRTVVGVANGENGAPNNNASITGAGDQSFANATIEATNNAYAQAPLDFLGQQTTLSTSHMYPFVSDFPLSGPWDWHDQATLEAIVAGTNAALGTTFDAAVLNSNAMLTNPTLSRETGMAYIDTIMDFFVPRAYLAMQLDQVNVNETPLVEAGLTLAPNPSTSSVRVTTDNAFEIIDLGVYDMTGKLVQFHVGINTNDYAIYKKDLAPGMYVVKARFVDGIQASKILFQ